MSRELKSAFARDVKYDNLLRDNALQTRFHSAGDDFARADRKRGVDGHMLRRTFIATTGGVAVLTVGLWALGTAQPSLVRTLVHAAATVSEPATLSLLGAGLFGAAWVARRRRGKLPTI
jgi:hypothetical protein